MGECGEKKARREGRGGQIPFEPESQLSEILLKSRALNRTATTGPRVGWSYFEMLSGALSCANSHKLL